MELGYSTIALLFPAIPLMFLVYSNTSTHVGARLRELFEAVSRGDVTGNEYNRVCEEAEYLAKRLFLLFEKIEIRSHSNPRSLPFKVTAKSMSIELKYFPDACVP